MGLRLYTPPVESDVRAKPTSEKSPAHARSAIRRNRISRQTGNAAPAERSRVPSNRPRSVLSRGILTEEPRYSYLRDRDARRDDLEHHVRRSNPPMAPPPPAAASERSSMREATSELGIVDDPRFAFMFPERWARYHAGANPGAGTPRDGENALSGPSGWHAEDIPQAWRAPLAAPPAEGPYATSSLRSTQSRRASRIRRADWHLGPSRTASRYEYRVPEVTFADSVTDRNRVSPGVVDSMTQPHPPSAVPVPPRPTAYRTLVEEARLDGLGDRNRSPEPRRRQRLGYASHHAYSRPSATERRLSFASASASASAAATQTTAAGSAGTSLTEPDTADDSSFEPPCESGCENCETDGGEEDEDEDEDEDDEDGDAEIEDILARFEAGFARTRRTYADVVAESGARGNTHDDALELASMHRIVRHLARREDIPDEWWAEAGLSRNMARETSN